jgi:hypothetical protein
LGETHNTKRLARKVTIMNDDRSGGCRDANANAEHDELGIMAPVRQKRSPQNQIHDRGSEVPNLDGMIKPLTGKSASCVRAITTRNSSNERGMKRWPIWVIDAFDAGPLVVFALPNMRR